MLLIHSADIQPRLVGIAIFTHDVRPSVRTAFKKSTKQLSNENSNRYWRDCGSLAQGIIDDFSLVGIILCFNVL